MLEKAWIDLAGDAGIRVMRGPHGLGRAVFPMPAAWRRNLPGAAVLEDYANVVALIHLPASTRRMCGREQFGDINTSSCKCKYDIKNHYAAINLDQNASLM